MKEVLYKPCEIGYTYFWINNAFPGGANRKNEKIPKMRKLSMEVQRIINSGAKNHRQRCERPERARRARALAQLEFRRKFRRADDPNLDPLGRLKLRLLLSPLVCSQSGATI